MKLRKNKNLVFIILLLFVGQVISAPFSVCSSSNSQDSHSMSAMDMTSMSSHDMSMNHADNNISDSNHEMDCCDNCQCPIGMCLSQLVYSNDETINILTLSNQIKLFSHPEFINKTSNSSIYRPPILS